MTQVPHGCPCDADTDKTITASIGTIGKNDKTGPAVQSLKLLAQATGEYPREELNKDGKLGWTDKTAAEIAAVKAAVQGGTSPSPSQGGDSQGGSQNQGGTDTGGGTNTGGGSDNTGGGDNGGDDGDDGLDKD